MKKMAKIGHSLKIRLSNFCVTLWKLFLKFRRVNKGM